MHKPGPAQQLPLLLTAASHPAAAVLAPAPLLPQMQAADPDEVVVQVGKATWPGAVLVHMPAQPQAGTREVEVVHTCTMLHHMGPPQGEQGHMALRHSKQRCKGHSCKVRAHSGLSGSWLCHTARQLHVPRVVVPKVQDDVQAPAVDGSFGLLQTSRAPLTAHAVAVLWGLVQVIAPRAGALMQPDVML